MAQGKETAVVAKAMKITPQLLHEIEQGKYDMELQLLFRLCHYYKIGVATLFESNEIATSIGKRHGS